MHTPSINKMARTRYAVGGWPYIPQRGNWAFSFCFVQGIHHLHQLAADEVGPGADFGGNAVGAGELLVHALSEELGSLVGL